MASIYPALGASVLAAGLSKLVGSPGYRALGADLGWTDAQMQRIGAAEVLGGALMIPRLTRRLGAAIVVAASARVLWTEIERGDFKLGAPRSGILLGALGGLIAP